MGIPLGYTPPRASLGGHEDGVGGSRQDRGQEDSDPPHSHPAPTNSSPVNGTAWLTPSADHTVASDVVLHHHNSVVHQSAWTCFGGCTQHDQLATV